MAEKSNGAMVRAGPVGRWVPRDAAVRVRGAIGSRFEVDTRSLAALRIALALIILLDLLHRGRSVEQFYTDDGVYPVTAYESTFPQFSGLSLHAVSGDTWFQYLLFGAAALFALALLLGYRTRLSAFVSFVLLISLHARNPAVLNGADGLLRVLLLVALVTPLGERWSIDAVRRNAARDTVSGVVPALVLIQPLVVLTQNAILKRRGETWYAGEGVELALSSDEMTIYLGNSLVQYPVLLETLNWIWVVLLAGSVVFLLATTGRTRAFFAFVYCGAFLGMAPTVAVGLFPLVLTASMLPFLTTPFWNAVTSWFPSLPIDRAATIDRGRERLAWLAEPTLERRLWWDDGEALFSSVAVYGRSVRTVLAVFLLCWMLLFGAVHGTGHDLPDTAAVDALDQQQWGLYAPDPSESYNWNVVTADGSVVGVSGTALHDRPPDASREYDSFRERKYLEAVSESARDDTNAVIAEHYAEWACERADAKREGRVETVTVYRFTQPIPSDGSYADPERETVIERDCHQPAGTPVE